MSDSSVSIYTYKETNKGQKMKLYAVAVAYEGIYSVFSSVELAKAYIAEADDLSMYVLEIEVDNPAYSVEIA